MGRRKTQDSGAAGLLVLLVALLAIIILTASVVGTVAIFALAWRNYARVRHLPVAPSLEAFAWTSDEAQQASQLVLDARQAQEAIQEAYARGGDRKRREDGLFIARGLGLELNGIIERATRALHAARWQLQELRSLPQRRADAYIRARANATAGAVAVVVFGVAFVLLLVTAWPSVLAYAAWLEGYLPGPYRAELSHVFASASLGCAVGWASYAMGQPFFAFIERRRLEAGAEQPSTA